MTIKVLDCTIRDGGYYTNWDFDALTVDGYVTGIKNLPIDYIEVGYRSFKNDNYYGQFLYCPKSTLAKLRQALPSVKIGVMLDLKDIGVEDMIALIKPIKNEIDLVRFAVNPFKFNSVELLEYVTILKSYDLEVALNFMYLSDNNLDNEFISNIKLIEAECDYIYLVDSFGSCYPDEVFNKIAKLKSAIECPIGFHGHNNLELALINSVRAIDAGATIIDSTFQGMGRGAGNLKTELLLTHLNAQNGLNMDFSELNKVTQTFDNLLRQYQWGTNLAYMFSGAFSLPQKDVMAWMSRRRYNFRDIITKLDLQKIGENDNVKLPELTLDTQSNQNVLIIGGGLSLLVHKEAIENLANLESTTVIYTSSKAIAILDFAGIFCTSGKEIYELEALPNITLKVQSLVYPAYPRSMGTYVPKRFEDRSFELSDNHQYVDYGDAPLAMALAVVEQCKPQNIYVCGFDGYAKADESDLEIHSETQAIFDIGKKLGLTITSLTPTLYNNLTHSSVYALL